MDAPLMYEVLLYLNVYYFGVFAGSEMLIVFAKFNGPLPTPHIELDGAVVAGILISELIKLLMFNRLRDLDRKCLSDFLAQFLTALSLLGLVYIFVLQHPVLKIEYIVCTIMFLLLITEFTYGFLQFVPCCKKKQYAE
ncbi:uncharacterized protein [Atheta coriaria]|uniref:uncharacterized protein n=1 Tax=Dalotia coriaria TaxID=877792 RepID=UPI0031F3D4BC